MYIPAFLLHILDIIEETGVHLATKGASQRQKSRLGIYLYTCALRVQPSQSLLA